MHTNKSEHDMVLYISLTSLLRKHKLIELAVSQYRISLWLVINAVWVFDVTLAMNLHPRTLLISWYLLWLPRRRSDESEGKNQTYWTTICNVRQMC